MVKETVNIIENIVVALSLLSTHGLILFLVIYMRRDISVTNYKELCKKYEQNNSCTIEYICVQCNN
jgi:hypothetical protein